MPEIKDWRTKRERYQLFGSECKKCNTKFFPRKKICRECRSEDMITVTLPRTGKLITYSKVHSVPAKFERYAPYIVGIIELEGDVRILAQIVDIDIKDLKTGMELTTTIRKSHEYGNAGQIVYGIKFRPSLESRIS